MDDYDLIGLLAMFAIIQLVHLKMVQRIFIRLAVLKNKPIP
ncbi:MAG TPA: hypothetical protein VLX91_14785 [Candidatus Acidoferrales bacterium]|nr:hypothetical protein [Candidatus Acidoferrales bacterium]